MAANIELRVVLSGIEYTDATAVDRVKQVFDRGGVNYKEVEVKGHPTTKKATAAKSTKKKSARKKATARRKSSTE